MQRAFLERGTWERLVKKPVIATDAEQAENPRSRSAKLRVARRQTRVFEEEPFEEFDEDDGGAP